jgi:hypothetical protein
MAIKDDETPGGSITQTNDAMDERIANISNVNKTVDGMEKDVTQEIEETEEMIDNSEDIEKVQSSMIGVLKKINETVGVFSKGIKKVTISTAASTKNAISQYGRAVSEDISFNKQNVVAMALARSTPLFGYFAAKFMETDVFKSAAAKLREGFGNVLGSVATKFKEGFGGIIDKIRSRKGKITKGEDVSSINEKNLTDEPIPKMQHGGYVSKGGLAELHPAEVVMPIEKVLSNVDDRLGTFENMINIYRKEQLKSIANMQTFVATQGEKQKVGLVKGFIRAWGEVNTQYLEPDSKRQLRALLAIQDALGAQIGTWRQVWQKMLIEHPMFRQIIFLAKTIGKTIGMPFKAVYAVFKARGGYEAHLSRSRNPMAAAAENIGLVYSEGMWRLDNITLYTRATAEATRDLSAFITGKTYDKLEGISTGTWRLSNLITKPFMWAWRKGMRGIESGIREALIGAGHESLAEILTKERSLTIGKRKRQMGEVYGGLSETAGEEKAKKELNFYETMMNCCKVERKDKEIEHKRDKKMLSYNKDQTESLVKVKRRLRSKNFLSLLMTFGGFLMSTLRTLFSGVTGILSGAMKGIGLLGPFISKIATGAGLAKFLGPAAGLLAAGAIGAGIGTLINKYLVAPFRDKWFKGIDEAKAESRKGTSALQKELLALKKKPEHLKTAAEKQRQKTLGTQMGDIGARFSKEQKKRYGKTFFGLDNLSFETVRNAQMTYMGENVNEYMKYDSLELRSLRSKWLKHGPAMTALEDPIKYGRRREAGFLAYIKKHATPITLPPTLADKFAAGGQKIQEVGQEVMDRTALAAEQAKDKLVEVNALTGEIKKGLVEVGGIVKEGAQESIVAVNNMSTVVSNSVQNQTSSTVAAGRRGLSQTKDYFNEKIVTGRIN